MRSLVKGCRLIEELHLGGCVQLTDDAIVELTFALGGSASSSGGDGTPREAKPATLRVLDLQDCALLTDKSVECVRHSCTHLSSFNLFGVPNLSAKVVDQNLSKMSRLRHLALSDGGAITAAAVRRLCAKRPMLNVHFDSYPPDDESA